MNKSAAVAMLFAFGLFVAVMGDTCHYDCYNVDPAAGQTAKQTLFTACGVTDFSFGTAAQNNLAGIYKQAAPAGCQLATCGRFADANAITSYRNDCEHPKPEYQVLNGKGAGRYDAPCTSCTA